MLRHRLANRWSAFLARPTQFISVPIERPESVVRVDLPCSPCNYRRLSQCPFDHACMKQGYFRDGSGTRAENSFDCKRAIQQVKAVAPATAE